MRYEVRGVVQNALMGIPPVRRLAMRAHKTGMNGDPAAAGRAFASYQPYVDVAGRDVLELGPGQTPQVLQLAVDAGARRCVGVDIWSYTAPVQPRGVTIDTYDGRTLPYADGSFDIVWSSDVFEHLRYPHVTVGEVFRVLRPGGTALARIDLRDHYTLDREERWLDCLKYPEWLWTAMTWNRSSYVNRLRLSDWKAAFAGAGFLERACTPTRSDVLARLHHDGGLPVHGRRLTEDDATAWRVGFVMTRP